MTKLELTTLIAKEMQMEHKVVERVVQNTLDQIIFCIVRDNRLELRQFGIFEVRKRQARTCRNPKTKKEVWVPSRKGVHFHAGKKMQERIQKTRCGLSSKGPTIP